MHKLPDAVFRLCPECKTDLRSVTHAQSLFMYCKNCSILIDYSVAPSVLRKINPAVEADPVFAIGTKGRLKGITYEVVGYIKWNEQDTLFYWDEYILFNPVKGYVHLSEYKGHWLYLEITSHYPRDVKDRTFVFDEKRYQLFNKYYAVPYVASGEFYWNIRTENFIEEYIHPPYLFIKEQSDTKCTWLSGQHITSKELLTGFAPSRNLPYRTGVGMAQPFLEGFNMISLRNVTLAAFFVLVCLFIFFTNSSRNEIVLSHTIDLLDSSALKPYVSDQFKVKGGLPGTANLNFNFFSPVVNDWIEAGITLVNDDTNEEYSVECGVEHYQGADSDGTWSEGSQNDEKFFSYIPSGTYHLVIVPFSEHLNWGHYMKIEVVEDVPIYSNFIFTTIALLIFPIIMYSAQNYFEKSRWENSDYSSYGKS